MAVRNEVISIEHLEHQVLHELVHNDIENFEVPRRFQTRQMCGDWNVAVGDSNKHSGIVRFNDDMRNALMLEFRNCMLNDLPFIFVHVDSDNLKQANAIGHWFGNFCIKRSAVNATRVLDNIPDINIRRIMVAVPSETAADDLFIAVFPDSREHTAEIIEELSGIDRMYKMEDPVCNEYMMSSSYGVLTDENLGVTESYESTLRFLSEGEERLPKDLFRELMELLEKRAHFYKEVKTIVEFPGQKSLLMLENDAEFEKRIADFEADRRGDRALSKLKIRLTRYHDKLRGKHGKAREKIINSKLKRGVLSLFPEIKIYKPTEKLQKYG